MMNKLLYAITDAANELRNIGYSSEIILFGEYGARQLIAEIWAEAERYRNTGVGVLAGGIPNPERPFDTVPEFGPVPFKLCRYGDFDCWYIPMTHIDLDGVATDFTEYNGYKFIVGTYSP